MEERDPVLAKAVPTKSFFVGMLVRDIELKDAILDLLDNCVDGVLRSSEPDLKKSKPYQHFRADLTIGREGFVIEDNCGGIPFKIAQTSAFSIGKPVPIEGADATATVGMYGIGMKRAIFKFGRDAVVRSWNDQPFQVHIDEEWLGEEGWQDLPMTMLAEEDFASRGTRIEIKKLYPHIAADFASEAFLEELRRDIGQNYSLIIAKGFSVTVRARAADPIPAPINAEEFRLLQTEGPADSPAIAPYIYYGSIDGVEIEIFAGLYRKLPDAEEQEREEETSGSSDDAGWTIACNDRVVVWKDRSRLTGWGEATVPQWHGQFIAVTGLVLLRSQDPKRLPLTTTKRGLDAGSDIYLQVKEFMREATKGLTSFTNKWKKFPDQLEAIYQNSHELSLAEMQASRPQRSMKAAHKTPTISRAVPNLPTPPETKTTSRVSFVARNADVQKLASIYFGDAKAKPKSVGEEAFSREVQRYPEAAE